MSTWTTSPAAPSFSSMRQRIWPQVSAHGRTSAASRRKNRLVVLMMTPHRGPADGSAAGNAVGCSVSDDFYQHPLRSVAVELAVEDLLPGPEVELPLRDGHDDLAAH